MVVGSGCALDNILGSLFTSSCILEGTDDAGAVIQLERAGASLTKARVVDLVLGTGEAAVIRDGESDISFTVDFPAGVAITYKGTFVQPSAGESDRIEGTWIQHPAGIFGTDQGTWEVTLESTQ